MLQSPTLLIQNLCRPVELLRMKKSNNTLSGSEEIRLDKFGGTGKQSRIRFDTLLEGIQIIDFNWCYVYVNDTLVGYERTSKEEFLGHSLLERYPGIEHTPVFSSLKSCMIHRSKAQTKVEFVYPDLSKKWFQLSIEPVDTGIMVLSLDITTRNEADEKISRANHLYSHSRR